MQIEDCSKRRRRPKKKNIVKINIKQEEEHSSPKASSPKQSSFSPESNQAAGKSSNTKSHNPAPTGIDQSIQNLLTFNKSNNITPMNQKFDNENLNNPKQSLFATFMDMGMNTLKASNKPYSPMISASNNRL